MDDKKYSAPAVIKTMDILELMAKENRPFSVTELSTKLSIPINSVFRIMKELITKNYINKNLLDSTYELTAKLYYLGSAIKSRISLINLAKPSLLKIRDLTRETVLLTTFGTNFTTLIIDQLESTEPIKFVSTVGVEFDSYSSAFGKAMLSHLSLDELSTYFSIANFKAITSNTITNVTKLKDELSDIKKSGIAYDFEESVLGLRCIAVPILSSNSVIEGAIGISGLVFRLSDTYIHAFSQIVKQEANRISETLGY